MTTGWRCVAIAGLLAMCAGCASASIGGVAGKQIRILPTSTVPATVGGLQVRPEATQKLTGPLTHTYLSAIGFFTLRKATHVEGTLEIAQISSTADLASARFRSKVATDVTQSGDQVPTSLLVDGVVVEETAGLNSTITTWFRGPDLVVLTVLQTYPQTRGLLEAVVQAVKV